MNQINKINPWIAEPLTDAAKSAKFRAVMNLSAERVILGRSAIIAGWAAGGIGVLCIVASMVGWVTVLPLKTTEIRFFLVDKSSGIIGEPVGLEDAPKIFGAAVEQQYIRRYIEARENWIPQMDERNDHIVKIMSDPKEQAHYADSRNGPNGSAKILGKDGHALVENLRYHPLALGKDGETRRYLVQYDRAEWHGSTKDTTKSWSATIDFQWKPGLKMLPEDRSDNPGGFQAIGYSASQDTPDQRRQ